MKFNLPWKIGLLVLVPLLVTGSLVGVFAFKGAAEELMDHEIVDLRDEAKLQANLLNARLAMLREDVLRVSRHEAVWEMIQAYERGRPEEFARVKDDVTSAFLELPKYRMNLGDGSAPIYKPYLQIRLIGADGKEIVRVNRVGEEFKAASEEELSNKGREPYFLHFKPSEENATKENFPTGIHLTEVGRNTDKDYPAHEGIPVMRAAVGLRTSERGFFGIVVINLDFDLATEDLVSSPRHLVYITDENGRLLYHPDSKTVKQELENRRGNIRQELPKEVMESAEMGKSLDHFYFSTDQLIPVTPTQNRRKFENQGHRIPSRHLSDSPSKFQSEKMFSMKDNKRFFLAKIKLKKPTGVENLDGMSDDDLKELDGQLSSLREDEINTAGFRSPLQITRNTEVIPLRAASDERLQEITKGLQTQFRGKLEVVHESTKCQDFIAFLFRIYFDPDDPQRFLAYMMAFSHDELQADLGPTRREVLRRGSACVLLFAVIALLFAKLFVTRPLQKLTHAADSIARGRFDTPLPVQSRDEIGELSRGFAHMIQEVQSRDAELRKRALRLRMIVDTAAEGIITLNQHARIESINPAARQMFHLEDDAPGVDVYTLLASNSHDELRRFFETVDSSNSEESSTHRRGDALEAIGIRKTEEGVEQFPLELSISASVGRQPIITLIARDITDRKKAEDQMRRWNQELQLAVDDRTAKLKHTLGELEKAIYSRDTFLATVSHELRTPLNHICGYAQLLEMTDITPAQRVDLQNLRESADQLLAIINDILDYQKIIMGRLPIEPQPFNLAELLSKVQESNRPRAEDRGNRLEVSTSGELRNVVNDPRRLRQILDNLVGNACKFTTKGLIRIAARSETVDGVESIVIDVSDTGVGMSPEAQGKLFQPFSKVGGSELNPDGTGLGLVISRGLARGMGGDLTAKSIPGDGSTFSTRIRRQLTESLSMAETDSSAPPPSSRQPTAELTARENVEIAPRTYSQKVLVIDDDPKVRNLIGRFLTEDGLEVISAESGMKGLELARQQRPDVITLDVIMPGLDGWSALAALKTDPLTADVPVVLVTVLDEEQKGYLFGAADYVSKPVNRERLARIVRHYCGKTQARVLIVEDNPKDREILRRLLVDDGWHIEESENGAEALEKLESNRPDLILLDLMMPVMDGFEFVEELHRRHPQHPPIVVMTAKETDEEERNRLNGLVSQIVQKSSFNKTELLRVIHRLIRPDASTS